MFRVLIVVVSLAFGSAAPQTVQGRVVGGENAQAAQFPHQVSLREEGSHICGGSIISRYFILTAAHCVQEDFDDEVWVTPVHLLSIRAGSLDRFRGGMLINVAEIIVHENYGDFFNDVAVLKLEKPLIFSNQIRALPLASRPTLAGQDVIISGWGLLRTEGDQPRELQWNTLRVTTGQECDDAVGEFNDNILCLAHAENNGACNGDSGGPATYNGEIVGIASFVTTGCGSTYPDGYANVFYHRDWIIKHAQL